MRLSIIVPIAPNEISWLRLIQDLKPLKQDAELILLCGDNRQKNIILHRLEDTEIPLKVITAPDGRAQHLNAGAEVASGEFLWFVHADSQIPYRATQQLMLRTPDAHRQVFYFDLKFLPDGPRWMGVNEWGVWFRCRFLRAPFGDQALFVSKRLFEKIGPYPETAPYGEDHLWVWLAHRQGIPVTPIGAYVLTSARKYQHKGWFFTTGLHLRLFFKQYLQQLWITVRERLSPQIRRKLKI